MKKFFALCAVSLSLMSCSTMSRQRDDAEYKKVKSAAVVAFILKEPASDVLAVDIGSGAKGAQLGGSSFYQTSTSADQSYQDLTAYLSKQTGWSVLALNDVQHNKYYTDEATKLMAPIKILHAPPSGSNWYLAKDVMAPSAAEIGGREERNKLMNALGVDAIVVATVDVSIKGGFSLNGLGPRKPQSNFVMKVYERDHDKPIWNEEIQGEKSEESLGWIGFIDEKRMDQLAAESTKTALARINSEIK